VPYRSLDHDSLKALRSYLYGEESGVREDEEALLNSLEKTWREGVRADHEKMVENIPVFIARERAILTWIELKRHLAALERADQRTEPLHCTLNSILTHRQAGGLKGRVRLRLKGAYSNTGH
jgi:hypothetical protein